MAGHTPSRSSPHSCFTAGKSGSRHPTQAAQDRNTDAAPSGASIKISGVTLSNGLSTDGGAIYIGDESLTIQDCVISNSSASEDGGAINIQNAGSLLLVRSTISGNTASDDGGGIYFFSSGSCYLIDSSLVNNRASTGNGGGRRRPARAA